MRKLLVLSMMLSAGCDYSGDWLFPDPENAVPAVLILEPENGGRFFEAVPVFQANDPYAAIRSNTVYAEIGAPVGTDLGGATLEFLGTGGPVCIWADPETVSWHPSVSAQPSTIGLKFAYPDNLYDDGDLDMYVGLSAHYTGSPGSSIGDFNIRYQDGFGNPVELGLSECSREGLFGTAGSIVQAGRGGPEFCEISSTQAGTPYTALLQTWSTPLDDDRLGFGVIVMEGSCETIRRRLGSFNAAGDTDQLGDECIIQGESIIPQGKGVWGPYYGYNPDIVWSGSIAVESAYCSPLTNPADPEDTSFLYELVNFCEDEAVTVLESGLQCGWDAVGEEYARCFCGDPRNLPGVF